MAQFQFKTAKSSHFSRERHSKKRLQFMHMEIIYFTSSAINSEVTTNLCDWKLQKE